MRRLCSFARKSPEKRLLDERARESISSSERPTQPNKKLASVRLALATNRARIELPADPVEKSPLRNAERKFHSH